MKHVYAIFTECVDPYFASIDGFVCCYSNKEEAEKHNNTIPLCDRTEVSKLIVYDTYAEAQEDSE